LSVTNSTELTVHRQAQQDLTFSVSESQVARNVPQELTSLLNSLSTNPSSRIYTFPDTASLHQFQAALTGYNVLYDGTATSFAISRRRMVVPIYKKWDATSTRIQIVRQQRVVQLLAFFKDFSHGECMNFTLKGTDVFESLSRGGKVGVRIVDAKFALPKGGETDKDRGKSSLGVCLDMPDYPGEHDDITISFSSDAGKLFSLP
jgi:hypothetical protein